jgi:mono/diheme cytochrome c family protein
LALVSMVLAASDLRSQSPAAGEALFQSKCIACHTIGGGDLVGPDLAGVTERRPREWLLEWIQRPDAMLARGDALALQLLEKYNRVPMLNLGLSEADSAALIAFLAQAGGAATPTGAGTPPAAAEAASSAPPPAGDPSQGKNLFTGAMRFGSGGPPCMGCHSAAGIGALGGGALGPDLTGVVAKYGGAPGLSAFLGGVPTPTMSAVWSGKPLSAQERGHVIAFLQQAVLAERPAEALWRLFGLAAGGLVVLLVLSHVVWRRRLTAVRRPMVARSARRGA